MIETIINMHFSPSIKPFSYKLLVSLLFYYVCHGAAFSSEKMPLFDSHSHYKTADAIVFSPQDVLEKMDNANITHMVIVGEPPENVQKLYEVAPSRIIPFLGLYSGYRDKANWMHNDHLPEKLEALLQQGHYKGIGEIHLFKQDRNNKNFKRILGLADNNKLPILFHGDVEVVDQIFAWFPDVTVIWAHLGTEPDPGLLRNRLNRYPDNLYIDTSVRDERIMANGKLLPEWQELFMAYPNRFLVGIDTFYTPRWRMISLVVRRIRQWLSYLPEPVARKLAYENANKLFLGIESAHVLSD